ncbi:MAG: hypothetical protein M3203_10405 [Actinomycetota bacterium]|nr:hypothetical protein [Actinomycetota bacterium]
MKSQLGALALLAIVFVVGVPAHALSADEVRPAAADRHGEGVDFTDDGTLLGNATSGGGLPFARPDLVILVLGGAVVTVAAAGAPLLLRPLRGIPPVFVAASAASEPLLPAAAQGATAHGRA